jgi:AcrR family transcriptional regulator
MPRHRPQHGTLASEETTSPPARRGYHHGDLRGALISAGREMISDVGVANFSVAAVARRLGVSSGAPYRHFPDREALLAAVAVDASKRIIQSYREAMKASDDPVEQLLGAAVAYMRVASQDAAGFGVVYSDEFDNVKHQDLLASRREITDLLLAPCVAVTATYGEAVELLEAYGSLVHGYAALMRDRAFGNRAEGIYERAASAARKLIAGYASTAQRA